MTEKTFTVEEMQNWNKRYRISKEDPTRVIDTLDGGEFWTVHGNEAYNLCILLNEQDQKIKELKKENEKLKQMLKQQSDGFELTHTHYTMEFNKDELCIKDNNTKIELKNGNLFITVFIPDLNEIRIFRYHVTGRSFEKVLLK